MSLAKIKNMLSELRDKISNCYIERDSILHAHGHKISAYKAQKELMHDQFYPKNFDGKCIHTRPSVDFLSDQMVKNYARLWELQMASAPFRLRLAELSRTTKAYESEQSKLLLERQEIEKKPQSELEF